MGLRTYCAPSRPCACGPSWRGRGPGASYLVHLVHVVLRVPPRALGRDGVSCRGRPRAGSHDAVGGARGGAWAGAQHGSRGGAWAGRRAWPRSSAQGWVRCGHLHRSCGQWSPAGKKSWSVWGSQPLLGWVTAGQGRSHTVRSEPPTGAPQPPSPFSSIPLRAGDTSVRHPKTQVP